MSVCDLKNQALDKNLTVSTNYVAINIQKQSTKTQIQHGSIVKATGDNNQTAMLLARIILLERNWQIYNFDEH